MILSSGCLYQSFFLSFQGQCERIHSALLVEISLLVLVFVERKKWESFLPVLFDYSKGAAVFALCYPLQVFVNLNNGTSVIRKILCLLRVLKKV